MSSKVKVNGEWKESWNQCVKVDGEWRPANVFMKVNGEWKESYHYELTEKDIIGFKLIYSVNPKRKHLYHYHLNYNPTLPVRFDLTGKHIGQMDTTEKGVLYQYLNEDNDNEGVLMYEGRMYAIHTSGILIDVGLIPSSTDKSIGIGRIQNNSIEVVATTTYQCFGYYMAGWNSFFDHQDFIDYTVFPDIGPHDGYNEIPNLKLLPLKQRSEDFASIASIGIARDIETPVRNMVGNHGSLSQSIHKITMNGIEKPFLIEIQT